jgi:outer membrane phospholipase A
MPLLQRNIILKLCTPVLLICALLWPALGRGEDLSPLLFFAEQQLTAGDQTQLSVFFHNQSASTVLLEPATPLFLEMVTTSGTTREVQAHLVDAAQAQELAPGQFHRLTYRMTLPRDLDGLVQVRFVETATATVVLQLSPPPQIQDAAPAADEVTYHSLTDLESLYQSYSADLFTYEPIYFLVGTDPSKSKLQLSFKYRIFNQSGSLSDSYPWLSGLFLAYTQTSIWDLEAESIPFNDTSYKPQLLFQTKNLSRSKHVAGFFLRTGLVHESNGLDGGSSRSTNHAYIKPMAVFYHRPSRLGVMISPKLLTYINNEDDSNPDLPDYRGYFELEMRVGRAHGLMLTTNLGFASKGTSVTTDLTYPIDRLLGDNLNIYFQLQYSNRLAESLVNYQQRIEAVRLGIAIFR